MFSLARLNEKLKLNEGGKYHSQPKQNAIKNRRKKTLKHKDNFLSLETGKSIFSLENKDNSNQKKTKSKIKSQSKLGLSWRFYNKVVTEEENSQSNTSSIQLGSGSEIVNKIGKCKNKWVALDKTLSKKKSQKYANFPIGSSTKRKYRKRATKHNLQSSTSSTLLESENKLITPFENTETASLEYYKKRQKIQNPQVDSGRNEGESNEPIKTKTTVSSTSEKKEENCPSQKASDLSLEVVKFYTSLGEGASAEFEKMNDVQPTQFSSFQSSAPFLERDKIAHQYCTKEDKICLGSKLAGEGTLLVALSPQKKIFISGNYYLKLILGSISVLGYKFKEGEEQAVFSPLSHSVLSVDVLDGVPIKSIEKEKLAELDVPFEWARELPVVEDQLAAVVKLSSYDSNMTRLLSGVDILQDKKCESFDIDIWKEALGIHLIEDSEKPNWRLLRQSTEWFNYLRNIQSNIANKKESCFIITGGKNVGKSTLLKFFINSLLNDPDVTEVACLDLDPGQPEFAVPSCLSLSRICAPLLGPSFTHREKKYFTYQKKILFGDINVRPFLREYMEVVSTLLTEYRKFKSAVPLVINTMGYTANLGFDIMTDVVRITRPTHVITIESPFQSENYSFQLHSNVITSIKRGLVTSPGEKLHYDFAIFRMASKAGRDKNKMFREINLLGYLSGLWKGGEINIIGESCNPPVKIDWTTIAIYVQGSFVPQTHILQSINASLIALCKVDADCLEEVGLNLPLRIQNDCSWFTSNEIIGWGVVRGIDPVTREIHVLTPLTKQEISENVNVIASTILPLPDHFLKLFSLDDAPYRR